MTAESDRGSATVWAAGAAAALLVIGVAGFLAWDLAGVHLGIFFEGDRRLLVGVDLAPQVPLEEVFFLLLLCLTTMVVFTAAARGRRSRA